MKKNKLFFKVISSRLQDVGNQVYISEPIYCSMYMILLLKQTFSSFFFIGDKKCECSCKNDLFGAIMGILVLIIILLIIYVLWLHKKGNKLISFSRSYFITGFSVSSLNV